MAGDRQVAVRGRWAVATMFLANGFLFGSWAPQIPLLLPRHQITEATLGLLILGFGVGAVGAMLFSGRIILRFGSRRAVRVFAVLSAGTLAAVVFSPSLPVLVVTMAVMGACLGSMDVAINANAVIVERRLDRAIMSSSHGFWSLGGFFGGGAGGLVIDRIGAEAHSLIVSGVTMAMVLVAMPFLIGDPRPSAATATGKTPAGPAPARPRSGALYLLGMLAMFSLVPEGGVLDWAALYLTREYGASLSTASFGYAMFAGTMAVVRFLGDSVRNRFGAVATLRVSALIGAAGMIGAALAPDPWTAIACFGLSGLGIANLAPIIMSAAGNQPGATMGTGIALVATMAYTGLLFAPGVIGFAAEHVGYRVTYLVLAGLILVVAPLAGRVAAADRIGAVRPA